MDGDKTIITNETEERKYNPEKIALSIFSSSLVLFVAFFVFNSYFSSSISLASLQDSTYPNNVAPYNDQNQEVLAAGSDVSGKIDSQSNSQGQIQQYAPDPKAAIVVKVDPSLNTVVFQSNQNAKLPIASLTKLMTALLVLERYDLNAKTTIDQDAMDQTGEQGNLKLRETLSAKDLLYISLIESSNKAAYALAEITGVDNFVSLMNQRALELGMTNTHFADNSGLNPDSQSSVHDLAILTEYVYNTQPLFREIVSLKQYNLYVDGTFDHTLINTNQLLGILPGVVGGKTGFTNEARGCYMIINKVHPNDQTYFINIILGSEDRLSAIKYLIDNYNS